MSWFERILGVTWLLTLIGGAWEWWINHNYQNAQILLLTSVSCVLAFGMSTLDHRLIELHDCGKQHG